GESEGGGVVVGWRSRAGSRDPRNPRFAAPTIGVQTARSGRTGGGGWLSDGCSGNDGESSDASLRTARLSARRSGNCGRTCSAIVDPSFGYLRTLGGCGRRQVDLRRSHSTWRQRRAGFQFPRRSHRSQCRIYRRILGRKPRRVGRIAATTDERSVAPAILTHPPQRTCSNTKEPVNSGFPLCTFASFVVS